MAFKNRLLATAAIPMMAMMGLGDVASAAAMHPQAFFSPNSDVHTVQSDEDDLLKQQRKEKREERRKQRQQQQDDASGADRQKNETGKRQKQQNDPVELKQLDTEPVKPRRKNNTDADMQNLQDDSGQQEPETVKPRRKKDANAEDQQQDKVKAAQDDAEQVKPERKKKNNAASQEGPSDEEIRKALEDDGNQKQRKKREKQADKAKDGNSSIEEIETKSEEPPQAQDDSEAGDDKRKRRKADDNRTVKQNEQLAKDPSKSSDTIVLPVENGAAVLDSDKDADNKDANSRDRRKRQREKVRDVRVPKSDKDAQAGFKDDKQRPVKLDPVLKERGERISGFKGYDDVGGRRVDKKGDDRFILNIDGKIVIRGRDQSRLVRNGDLRYERLPDGRVREIVIRSDGTKIVTVRNRYGEIIRRSRIDDNGQEIIIFYSPDLKRGRDRLFLRDAGADLPPLRLRVPVRDYIIDVSSDRDRDYEDFLDQPPVEPVERVYSVDEVKYSARIRDKMRRIDLDTITFETGSAAISMDQASSLRKVGAAIKDLLDRDAGETFLIEGHTDAVGSDESNLVLSDSRAESVAAVLSDLFEIPPENLVTQGYGERYLKIETDGPARENRRVTIRRITPLVRPVASAE